MTRKGRLIQRRTFVPFWMQIEYRLGMRNAANRKLSYCRLQHMFVMKDDGKMVAQRLRRNRIFASATQSQGWAWNFWVSLSCFCFILFFVGFWICILDWSRTFYREQVDPQLCDNHLPLPSECWDHMFAPSSPALTFPNLQKIRVMLDEGERRPDQSILVMNQAWAHWKRNERGDIELTQYSPLRR